VKVANSAGAATQTVTIDVAGVGAGTLAPVAENTTNPAGESIAAIFTNNNVQNTTSSLTGIAITQNSNSGGTWEYSTDQGTTWNNIPTSLSATTALVLAASDLIRFVPNTNYSGSVAPLNVYGLDSAYTGNFNVSNVNVATLLTSNPADFVDPSTVAINTAILATPVAQWINASGGSWTTRIGALVASRSVPTMW
jgi:hypothetical protein